MRPSETINNSNSCLNFPTDLFGTRIWTQPNPAQVLRRDEDRVSHQFVNSLAKQPGQKDTEAGLCKLVLFLLASDWFWF